MADIFISYSSKDRAQAEQLTELLASAGLSVWIDHSDIAAASSWTAEIVDAINESKVLVALLSPSSIESDNVIKEISLASEKRKKILPLDLEPVTLPRELEYQLAGIQRTSITNIDSIIRALGKLGLEATGAPQAPKIVKGSDSRKSMMILPFEDLSPTGDNGWFADGIATELIAALGQIKSLRVADPQATKDYKRYTGTLPVYAREMGIRYFVQGSVRKFGDQIKITALLLDIETGDQLWQDSMKGVMNDIFDIQEKMAEKVVEGLKVHLTSAEKEKLSERGTDNAEAYELAIRARDYNNRHTREGLMLGAQLASEAIALDPNFGYAWYVKAYAFSELFSIYDPDPELLEQAERFALESIRVKPDNNRSLTVLCGIYLLQGRKAEAEAAAQALVREQPDKDFSHLALAGFYTETDQPNLAIACFERALEISPEALHAYYGIVEACEDVHDDVRRKQWAVRAIPHFETRLRLTPDLQTERTWYIWMLWHAGRESDAKAVLDGMSEWQHLDGRTLYNIALLYHRKFGEIPMALAILRRALVAGFSLMSKVQNWLTSEAFSNNEQHRAELESIIALGQELQRTRSHA